MVRPNVGLRTRIPGDEHGRVGYLLLWLLGVPIPVPFGIYVLRGCS